MPKFALEVVWFDQDMLELRLTASSAGFAGQANFYAALDEPAAFAAQLSGFPRSREDVREYEFGNTNLQGYGGANIRIACKDGSGHLVVQATIYMNAAGQPAVAESATVQLETVPASIDSFVEELQRMQVNVGQIAVLRDAT
ncbi:MAG: hypothetical protein JF614_18315 [Acidobacteria bacterium]|nr:hypothetical protein [Acidobacteriota bacterium]